MTRKRQHRVKWLVSCTTIVVLLSGCGTSPARDDNSLDPRFAGPCQRMKLEWSEAATALHIVHCDDARRRYPPLVFAYTVEPVDPDSVPLVVTGIPGDAWFTLTELWADSATADVLGGMGYTVELAELRFDFETERQSTTVSAEIRTETVRFAVTARTIGPAIAFEERRALVTDTESALSAFFGPEAGMRSSLAEVTVTPATQALGERGLGRPGKATLDLNVTSERVYWRLPKH